MTAKNQWALDKGGNKIATHAGTGARFVTKVGNVFVERFRKTIAEVNAGVTLVPAYAGFKPRLIDAFAIAVGGAVAAVTTVDVLGTQSASGVKLVAFGQADLTQSALVRAGSSGGVILADGASFAACDVNTAITAGKTGSDITTATHVDFVVTYSLDEA